MPITSSVLASGGADGTGFTTSSVSPVSGRLLQLTFFCASTVTSPSVTGLSLTWTRIDDPSQFPNEPMQRWAAVASGSSGTIAFSHSGDSGGIAYLLEEIAGQAGTTVADAYRDLGSGALATKIGPPFTPGDNIPSAFAATDNRAFCAFSGTQFGTWAGGTTPSLTGLTFAGRTQYEPNITIDLISGVGVDGESSYGITWANGPFTARGIYCEIIAAAGGGGSNVEITDAAVSGVGTIAASAALRMPIVAGIPGTGTVEAATTQTHRIASAVSGVGSVTVALSGDKQPYALDVKQLHSGHSLTDAGFHPWPGPWVYLLTEALSVSPFENIAKSTIPGSPLHYRWANETSLIPVSARYNIDEWEALIITEGVPLPLDGSSETHMALYAANAWENGNNGAGAPTLLFSTWTNIDDTDGPFRTMLDTYEPEWESMADAGTAALPPGAPPVFIVPGHRMMARFYDDIQAAATPAGIDNIADFFRDTIHLNDLGSYAWAMLHYACLFNASPVGLPRDLWGPNDGWGDSPDTPEAPTIPTVDQAAYIQAAVWDVVTSYERTGVTAEAPIAVGVTGTGTVSALVAQTHRVSPAVSGTGSVSGSAILGIDLSPAVSGAGTVSVATAQAHRISSGVSGSGTVTADVSVEGDGISAVVSGVGTVVASIVQAHRVQSAVSGQGAISALGAVGHRVSVGVSGIGNVVAITSGGEPRPPRFRVTGFPKISVPVRAV